jgi:hypothetical protein
VQLSADFPSLWWQVKRLTARKAPFQIERLVHETGIIDISLQGNGIEIELNQLENTGGLLDYQGRQVLLYIPDHGRHVNDVLAGLNEGKRFHVAHCVTLDEMRRNGRFERYYATADLAGEFTITGISSQSHDAIEGKAKLKVCMNCLKKLNYRNSARNWSTTARQVKRQFEIEIFFETYSSCFSYLPKSRENATAYTAYAADWATVSARKRAKESYTCEFCRVNLSSEKRLLHVHHVDGQKGNNIASNLRALCVDCHQKQPMHKHLFITHQDRQALTRLRRQQGLIGSGWQKVMEYADPAVKGALDLLRNKGWPAPEIGYELSDSTGKVIGELEAAWPNHLVGVRLNSSWSATSPKWRCYSLAEILENHDVIRL